MSPETHPENEHNIQREQQRLDELDAKRDSTIDIGEEREQLTQTYIKRVNDVQGHIRDLQKKIDVQKDMRAPHWQRLESVCLDVQENSSNDFLPLTKKTSAETLLRSMELLTNFSLFSNQQKRTVRKRELHPKNPRSHLLKLPSARSVASVSPRLTNGHTYRTSYGIFRKQYVKTPKHSQHMQSVETENINR